MKVFIKFISAVLALFIFSPSGDVSAYSPIDKDNLKTSFTVISDGHLESNNSQKHKNYGEFFCDTANAEVMSRTLIMLGDNTMNGQFIETSMLYGLLNKYNKIENVLTVAGNHDVCDGDYNSKDYETLKERFIKFNNIFLDNQIENLYYSRIIDGYHYIVLGTDADADIQQYISPEQFAWLDEELKSASESGNPVFLFSHWPLNDVFSDAWQEGHVGEQSDELKKLLTKYDNRIFFFTGHLHMGIFDDEYGIKDDGNITYINVPSFGCENDIVVSDVQDTGMGLQVEVYEDEIVVRVRNFVEHQWTDYEYHFDY
ncbi:MAG: metallophosphoesterase family protein [Eubacterium sp.]